MKIAAIDTAIAGNPWKNWMFVRLRADNDSYGIGEGTFNGFAHTTEAAVHEIKHLILGHDPFDIEALVQRLTRNLYTDGGHIHRSAVAAIEMACMDLKGKTLGVPCYQLMGGKVRDKIPAWSKLDANAIMPQRETRP